MRSAYALWAMADALRGRPSLATIIPAGPLASRDVLCLAASLYQVSRYVLAGAVVAAAAARQCELVLPERVEEDDMDIADLRGLLYGLHAILRLHTAQGRRKLPVARRRHRCCRAGDGVRQARQVLPAGEHRHFGVTSEPLTRL